jgi:serine/threonine-protein kinase 11
MADAPAARPTRVQDHKTPDERQRELKKVNQYALVQTLGRGRKSRVYLALDTGHRIPFAVKAVPVGGAPTDGLAFQRAIRIHRRLSHRNLVRLQQVLYTKRLGTLYLVLEWAPYGSLAGLVKAGPSDATLASIFLQVCHALSYLHSQGYVHHNIKPANILLFKNSVVKLSDFALGNSFEGTPLPVGTREYQAPELFDDGSDLVLDPVKETIWSLGVTLFEVASGELPFKNGALLFPPGVSETLSDLLGGMLDVNVATRFTLEGVMRHPFFAQATADFSLPIQSTTFPQVDQSAPVSYMTAHVCDDSYTFVWTQRSVSCPWIAPSLD